MPFPLQDILMEGHSLFDVPLAAPGPLFVGYGDVLYRRPAGARLRVKVHQLVNILRQLVADFQTQFFGFLIADGIIVRPLTAGQFFGQVVRGFVGILAAGDLFDGGLDLRDGLARKRLPGS